MMLKITLTLFSCLLILGINAQAFFSYSSDRKFSDPTELLGYDFKPSVIEIPGQSKEKINPGEYSFGITMNNLYVKGKDIEGVYNINNINTTDYGFKLLLINARDARLQGHLKVILNRKKQVDALVFRRSTKEEEIIFFLPLLTEELAKQETQFFTDRNELEVKYPDSIWGTQFRPFLKIHNNKGVQQRLQRRDSTSISFEMREKIIEKEIKKKSKHKEEVRTDTIAGTPDTLAEETETKIKIIRSYHVVVKQILSFDDGTRETKIDEYEIKKVKERMDELAGPTEEKYQIGFSATNGENLFLYLTGRRQISSFELENALFLARGH